MKKSLSLVLTYEEQKEEEKQSRINIIKSRGKWSDEGKLCELFILNFWHPTFRYLLKYEYEVVERRSDLGAGDIVFCSHKDSDQELRTVPRQVLIIEAKFLNQDRTKTAKTKRTKSRKMVNEQVSKYMNEWKLRHSHDEVYGAILMNERCSVLGSIKICDETYLSNKISDISLSKHGEPRPPDDEKGEIDDGDETTGSLELTFHPPLPYNMWSHNSKSHMDIDSNNLTLHQRWEFDLPKNEFSNVSKVEEVTAKFVAFDVVCVACHDLLHIGRAKGDGKEKHMFEYLRTKSGRQYIELEIDYILAWCQYKLANCYTNWKVSEDVILAHPIVQKWLKCDKRRTIGRFGSLCCLQDFNPVLKVDKTANYEFKTIDVGTTTD